MGSMGAETLCVFRLRDMVGIDRAASIQNIPGLPQSLPADFAAGSSSKIDRMQEARVMNWQRRGPERRRRAATFGDSGQLLPR
jgi:hypothetical protein